MTGGITDGIGGRIRGLAARKTAPALEPMLLWADTNLDFTSRGLFATLIDSFAICGVDWFVLISGWFGIRHGWSASLRLIVECVLFGGIAFGVVYLNGDVVFQDVFQSLNFRRYWFVTAYVMMALCAPFLEVALKWLKLKELALCVIGLTVVNVGFGWGLGVVSPCGYDFVNFLYLYVLGRLIRRVNESGLIWCKVRVWWALQFIFGGGILFSGWILINWLGMRVEIHRWFAYNSPVLLIEAVAGLMLFANLDFHNRIVNYMARGTFGVYVLHFAPCVKALLWNQVRLFYTHGSWLGVLTLAMAVTILGMIIGYIVTTMIEKVDGMVMRKIRAA